MRKSSSASARARVSDRALPSKDCRRDPVDTAGLIGVGSYVLTGPDGEIKQQGGIFVPPEMGVKLQGHFRNLVTDVGDEVIAKRFVSASVNVPTGMRLGTGTTAVAKNGAGAAIVTYVTASNAAFDGGFPTNASKGAGLGWRTTWQSQWAAGVATASGIAEAVITNETPLTNVAGTAANTVARALLSPTVNKGASDTLTITWNIDALGA